MGSLVQFRSSAGAGVGLSPELERQLLQLGIESLQDGLRLLEHLGQPPWRRATSYLEAFSDSSGLDPSQSQYYVIADSKLHLGTDVNVAPLTWGGTITATLGASSAGNAVDENISTMWNAGNGDAHSLIRDFGAGQAFAPQYMRICPAGGSQGRHYEISYSNDGSAWTLLKSGDITIGQAFFTVDLPGAPAARYWKLLFNSYTDWTAICEWEIHALLGEDAFATSFPITLSVPPKKIYAVAEVVSGDPSFWASRDDGSTWTQLTLGDYTDIRSQSLGASVRVRAFAPGTAAVIENLAIGWIE